MLFRAINAIFLVFVASASLAHAQIDNDEKVAIEKAADAFWENTVNVRKLLPDNVEQLSEMSTAYRDNHSLTIIESLYGATTALEEVTALALADFPPPLALQPNEKKSLVKKVVAVHSELKKTVGKKKKELLAQSVLTLTLTGLTGLEPVMASMATVGIALTTIADQHRHRIDHEFTMLGYRSFELYMRWKEKKEAHENFKARWEIFFSRLESERGIKLKGLTFKARFKNFKKWVRKELKIYELQRSGILPSACEALLSLPIRPPQLLLSATTEPSL